MLVEHMGPRTRARVAQASYRPRGHSDPDPSRPGQLVDPAGTWTRARVAQDCWWTPEAHGPWHKSPGIAGRHHVPTGTGPILPGLLIDPVGTWTRARVAGTAGQTRGPSDTVVNRLGQLVDITGSLTQA